MSDLDQIREAGMEVRRAVLGDAHVDRAQAQRTDLDRDFQDFITRYAWGEVWTRPGLDRRARSMITLATQRGERRVAQRPHREGDRRGAAAHRRLRRSAGGQRGVRDRQASARRGRRRAGVTRRRAGPEGPARLTHIQ